MVAVAVSRRGRSKGNNTGEFFFGISFKFFFSFVVELHRFLFKAGLTLSIADGVFAFSFKLMGVIVVVDDDMIYYH